MTYHHRAGEVIASALPAGVEVIQLQQLLLSLLAGDHISILPV